MHTISFDDNLQHKIDELNIEIIYMLLAAFKFTKCQ